MRFRFGVTCGFGAAPRPWGELARRVEDLGYSTLMVADHLVPAVSPIAAMSFAAAATTTLRVGTFVLNNDFRHPVLVAGEAATLDLLSGGRLELGLGAGHMQSEYDGAGIAFDSGAVRVDRLVESVAIIKGLLRGDKVTFEGQHYTVRDHAVEPRAAQRPHPPLLVGGNGRRVLELAAREADIVGFVGFRHVAGGRNVRLSHFGPAGLRDRLEIVRATAGARFDQLELNALVQRVVVTADRQAAAQALLDQAGVFGTVDDVLQSPFLLMGTTDEIADQLQARRDQFGISYVVVFEASLDDFAPVVARLAGT